MLAISELERAGHRVPPNYMYNTGSEQMTGNPEHDVNNRCRNQASEDQLGPLPVNWEKAQTDTGEVYFIEYVIPAQLLIFFLFLIYWRHRVHLNWRKWVFALI